MRKRKRKTNRNTDLLASLFMRDLSRLVTPDSRMAQKTGCIISGPASLIPYDTDKAHVSLCITECDNQYFTTQILGG
jgi:hypothetical protein